MDALKVTLFAVMMFSVLEGIPYLFFAFCAWDINWLPDSHWLFRAFYGITALFGLVVWREQLMNIYKIKRMNN